MKNKKKEKNYTQKGRMIKKCPPRIKMCVGGGNEQDPPREMNRKKRRKKEDKEEENKY